MQFCNVLCVFRFFFWGCLSVLLFAVATDGRVLVFFFLLCLVKRLFLWQQLRVDPSLCSETVFRFVFVHWFWCRASTSPCVCLCFSSICLCLRGTNVSKIASFLCLLSVFWYMSVPLSLSLACCKVIVFPRSKGTEQVGAVNRARRRKERAGRRRWKALVLSRSSGVKGLVYRVSK